MHVCVHIASKCMLSCCNVVDKTVLGELTDSFPNGFALQQVAEHPKGTYAVVPVGEAAIIISVIVYTKSEWIML